LPPLAIAMPFAFGAAVVILRFISPLRHSATPILLLIRFHYAFAAAFFATYFDASASAIIAATIFHAVSILLIFSLLPPFIDAIFIRYACHCHAIFR